MGQNILASPAQGAAMRCRHVLTDFGMGLFDLGDSLSRIAAFPVNGKDALEEEQHTATVRAMRAKGRIRFLRRQLQDAADLGQDQVADATGV